MNRHGLLQLTRPTLLMLAITSLFGFNNRHAAIKTSLIESKAVFPDKENYLVSATCIFKTPGWGDGKNGDDSFVDSYVDIECFDRLYSGHGGFGNNTEIESNIIREMPIAFSPADQKKIFYDGVKNLNIIILGHKPNEDNGRIPNRDDKWNVRWEFIMKFKKGQVLSTGYNDPAIEYHYEMGQKPINNPNAGGKQFFARPGLLNHRTIDTAN